MKKFKKIIFSICFILTFILSINIKLFAYEKGYTIDNSGNIDSLNLLNVINYKYKDSADIINNNIIFNSTTNNNYDDIQLQTYQDGTYISYLGLFTKNTNSYITFTKNNTYNELVLCRNGNNSLYKVGYDINNLENGKTYTLSLNVLYTNYNSSSTLSNIMLNEGTTPLEYFPYGIYYNSKNTLNNNSYLSPFNIDYVESETFYINGQLQQGEEPVGYGGTYLFYDIDHTNAQGQNTWKSIVNFNRILPSMTIYFNPTGNNFYELYIYKNEELIYSRNVRDNENLEDSDYYFTLPEFNRIELYCTIDNVSAPNQEIKLANTYEQGYTYGYSNGYNQGYAEGESSSYGNGYSTGYQKGVREANQNSLYNMILAIVDTPIHIFKGIFDFNVLGINLTNFVLSLISILIVVWLLKFFL